MNINMLLWIRLYSFLKILFLAQNDGMNIKFLYLAQNDGINIKFLYLAQNDGININLEFKWNQTERFVLKTEKKGGK